MHWSLFVLFGAIINVMANYGYKVLSVKANIFLIAACVSAVTSIALFGYVLISKTGRISDVLTGNTPVIIAAMGCGSAIVMFFLITAFSKGPLSLVDPLWACVYGLVSVLIGVILLKEAPSIATLAGIGLYLIGAFLMARG